MTERSSGRAVASLVCGILSWVGCGCFAAVAAILLGQGDDSDLARAGRLLGWINLALTLFVMIATLVFLAGAAVIAAIADHH